MIPPEDMSAQLITRTISDALIDALYLTARWGVHEQIRAGVNFNYSRFDIPGDLSRIVFTDGGLYHRSFQGLGAGLPLNE